MKNKLIRKIFKDLSKGMSLTETLIWVGIVGTFVSIMGISGVTVLNNARVKAAEQQMNIYSAALLEYYQYEGSFPTEDLGLEVLVQDGWIKSKTDSSKNFMDPWNNKYIYEVINDGQGFKIKSYGSDKKEGGTSKSATDIVVTSDTGDESGGSDSDI